MQCEVLGLAPSPYDNAHQPPTSTEAYQTSHKRSTLTLLIPTTHGTTPLALLCNSHFEKYATHLSSSNSLALALSSIRRPCNMSKGTFNYTPLDLTRSSIRLIRIAFDLSSDGLIQCELRQATITDIFICLSYVWGGEFNGTWIMLNGQRSWIRNNLWEFLNYARHKRHITWVWIDALCIDQANTRERVHQVQQMGKIYSKAEKVISWFGSDKRIARFLSDPLNSCAEDCATFQHSDYWTRAWIIQEIVLARSVTFMAGFTEVVMSPQPNVTNKRIDKIWREAKHFYASSLEGMKDHGLIFLLHIFQDTRCAFPRDRIFSMLAVCGDKPDITVDYEISDEELAVNVLRACSHSLCLCSAKIVATTLQLTTPLLGTSSLDNIMFARYNLPLKTLKRTVDVVELLPDPATAFYICRKNWKLQDRVTVAINLNHLCGIFGNLILEIRYHLGRTKLNYGYIELDTYHVPPQNVIYSRHSRRDGGFQVEFSDDRERCTLSFSFNFLIEVLSVVGGIKALTSCQSVADRKPSILKLYH